MTGIGIGIITAAVVVLYFALAKSAGMADRKMEELHRHSATGEAGGTDGN